MPCSRIPYYSIVLSVLTTYITLSIYNLLGFTMKCLHWHGVKQYIPILFFLCVTSFSAQATDIQGIAGYRLGDVLDKKQVLNETKAEDGVTVYSVKPLASDKHVNILTLRITPKQQIHRISAFSHVLSAADCQTQMTQLRIQTEKQFPRLGYYAMDQSEMFYQDDRTYTLECVDKDEGIRLRQEYSDDKLATQ